MSVFTIKLEYYRSFEYSVNWKDPMKPVRKSKRLKKSPNNCCDEDPIQRQIGRRRQQRQSGKKILPRNRDAKAEKLYVDDILDIIDRSHESEPDEEQAPVEVDDEGLEQSDDDLASDTNSVRSGPSLPRTFPTKTAVTTLCPVCRKLYQRAKKMKAPIKDKLLDTNPKSLSCDQWILLKLWSSKTVPDSRGNLSQLVHELVKKGKENDKLMAKEVCSRPHLFLTRNLQRCIRKPQKKKNWRKRSREDSQGPRVAKQQRLNNLRQPNSRDVSEGNSVQPIRNDVSHSSPEPMNGHCSTSSLESGEDSELSLRPVSVTLETDSSVVNPKQSFPKRGAGFKELLAQLRGNHSMIIRESSTEASNSKLPPGTGWKRS